MFIKTQGFMATLKPGGTVNVLINEKVTDCLSTYSKGKQVIMCKSARTGTWLLAKPERLSKRKVR